MAEGVVTFTDDNFGSEALKSDVPVLVDFWAEWCGPCRAQGPIVEQLAGQYAGKAKIGKLNVDDNNHTAQSYRVQSIPTILFFKGGVEKKRVVGLRSKDELEKSLKELM